MSIMRDTWVDIPGYGPAKINAATAFGGVPLLVQTLDGDQALAFVRERYAFADGDYQRVKDQQIFLKAVLSGVRSPATLTNPLKINDLVNQVSPYISVDTGLTSATVGALAVSLREIRDSDVVSFTLPTMGTGTSAGDRAQVVTPVRDIAPGDGLKNRVATGKRGLPGGGACP